MVSLGAAKGVNADDYAPGKSVTREQMASFIVRMLALATESLPEATGTSFVDVRGVHAASVTQLPAGGIAQGTTPTTFSRPVTREQMATFLVRAHEYATGQERYPKSKSHLRVVNSPNLMVRDFTITGANDGRDLSGTVLDRNGATRKVDCYTQAGFTCYSLAFEFQNGLDLGGATDVTVEDVTVDAVWGDGAYVSVATSSHRSAPTAQCSRT